MLEFISLEERHIDELTKIMERAFDEDTRIHLGKEKGGPSGYNDGSYLRKWGLHQEASSYGILVNQKLTGAIILWIKEDKMNSLEMFFLDPLYENQGIGTKIWNKIEAMYPDTKVWKTETPIYSARNHNFYVNKCGFQVVETEKPEDQCNGKYVFQKVMNHV